MKRFETDELGLARAVAQACGIGVEVDELVAPDTDEVDVVITDPAGTELVACDTAFVPGTGWLDSSWRHPTDRPGVIHAVTVTVPAGKVLEARRTGPDRFLVQMA